MQIMSVSGCQLMQMPSKLNRVFAHQNKSASLHLACRLPSNWLLFKATKLYVAKTGSRTSLYIWLARIVCWRCSVVLSLSAFAYIRAARESARGREKGIIYMQVSFVFPRGTRSEWVSERVRLVGLSEFANAVAGQPKLLQPKYYYSLPRSSPLVDAVNWRAYRGDMNLWSAMLWSPESSSLKVKMKCQQILNDRRTPTFWGQRGQFEYNFIQSVDWLFETKPNLINYQSYLISLMEFITTKPKLILACKIMKYIKTPTLFCSQFLICYMRNKKKYESYLSFLPQYATE